MVFPGGELPTWPCTEIPVIVSPASSHLLLHSLDLSAKEIPGINTALSEFYSRLGPWIPCQLLLVLHFCYSNSSVKTNRLRKVSEATH